MSIIGIGTDIIEIFRIKNIVYNFKDKLAERILSVQELEKYKVNKNPIKFLAKRFAVKEAASKALGTGISYGIKFNQIELYNNNLGKPKLRFLKYALQKSEEMKCKSIFVSISDEKLYACALVILEK
ncbi:holo-ACP synthase [Buchnera aphidicola]|jgi:holo-[acyl-carrier protein] synthase|uniref:Holo-[acyl-carrier-protein] synthase n=1 Tax=Buchnera aphidicola subsp. Schizaphis graminum (strain Sg) TaxID=198804 RepID=ACPS_BUCAP|nr:holo-ACP synthase [Buchnera aphidicola]Q8K9R3.1 RecName: Full=Holo-[acyl-carrier-protein] synthase; Short=Holo-ACP synthase; AltName: Full=4'-phosphopantetheinyl transferase AcpS [Buchnera aphidicola str. Sg (Schizaphis graminum)]AAM67806.1 holo-[acyl-carrier protein] synthase [Buchnera aphidicola str. Sg (Schizaphis graminum)]AWI49696.1 holo-ACP synthase [Buchnera aphidicola (Schizaphis graminum)]